MICTPINLDVNAYAWIIRLGVVFEALLHSLSFYCILTKSTPQMQNYRMHLIVHQIFASTFDFVTNIVMEPIYFMPYPVVYVNGLIKYFTDDCNVVYILHLVLLFGFGASVFELFFYRGEASIYEAKHFLKFSTFKFYGFLVFIYVIVVLSVLLGMSIGIDNNQAINLFKQNYPCGQSLLFIEHMHIYSIDTCYRLVYLSIIGLSWLVFGVTLIVALSVYFLDRASVSEYTRKIQKRYIRLLILQTVTPAFLLVLPAIYILIAILLEWENTQTFGDLAFISLALQGIGTSLAVIAFNDPYRQFVILCIKKSLFIKEKTSTVANSILASSTIIL